MEELSRFLQETVRVATEGRQSPSLSIGGGTRAAVLPRVNDNLLSREDNTLTLAASTATALPVLDNLTKVHSGRLDVSSDGPGDLFWDVEAGDVLTKFGDVVLKGNARNADSFAAVVAKWVFLNDLYALSRDPPAHRGTLDSLGWPHSGRGSVQGRPDLGPEWLHGRVRAGG